MKPQHIQKVKIIKMWVRDILISVIAVGLLTTFLVQNLRVLGASMAPTLVDGEMVLINKVAYLFSEPEVGDIIGFQSDSIKEKIVKRIVGIPGDIIDYQDGQITVNQVPLNYKNQELTRSRGDIQYPYTVPENAYFVLGDNIDSSIDSRYTLIGSVPKDKIIGRIRLRIWPIWKNPILRI